MRNTFFHDFVIPILFIVVGVLVAWIFFQVIGVSDEKTTAEQSDCRPMMLKDANCDGQVTLVDVSILLFWLEEARKDLGLDEAAEQIEQKQRAVQQNTSSMNQRESYTPSFFTDQMTITWVSDPDVINQKLNWWNEQQEFTLGRAAALSTWDTVAGTCTIWVDEPVDEYTEYQLMVIGHEMVHCFRGDYHE